MLPMFIWFIFWWAHDFPELEMWNSWSISLTICFLWWLFD